MAEQRSGGLRRSDLVSGLLKSARNARKLTLKEVSDLSKVAERTVVSIEVGEAERPRSYNVAKFAFVVGVTPAQLRAVGRDDAADDLAELILSSKADMVQPEPEFIASVRAKVVECGSLGRFIDWVAVIAGDVIASQHLSSVPESDVDGRVRYD